MADADSLPFRLLHETAAHIGQPYLQQLVHVMARMTGTDFVWLAERSSDLWQFSHILFSNVPVDMSHYPLAGAPCEAVNRDGDCLLVQQDVCLIYPQEAGTQWQSYIAWPLKNPAGECVGHLAMMDHRANHFSPSLLEDIAPFARRAACELVRLQKDNKQARQQHWQTMHGEVLRQNARGVALPKLLLHLLGQIEAAFPLWKCSVLTLDKNGWLRSVCSPSLPKDYHALIRGALTGPMLGAFGTAIWCRQRVIAENLQEHPDWRPYRKIVARLKLGCCWSEPMVDSKGKVHGIFAIYHEQPASPSAEVVSIMEDTARLLALLLENAETHRILDSRTQWYRAILQNAADALSIIDLQGRFLEASDSLCRMLGYSQDELKQLHLWDIDPSRDEAATLAYLQTVGPEPRTFEAVDITKDGRRIDIEVSSRQLTLDGQVVIWGSARDISQRKALQQTLERQATIDALTGLYNRTTLLSRMEHMLNQAVLFHQPLSILMLDMDHFKQVNDRYGHLAGDLVLIELGETLLEALRESDAAGRLGGEEFCIVLPCTSLSDAEAIAARIVDDVGELCIQHGQTLLAVTCSIGLTSMRVGDDCRSMLSRADAALYQAKAAGRNCAISVP